MYSYHSCDHQPILIAKSKKSAANISFLFYLAQMEETGENVAPHTRHHLEAADTSECTVFIVHCDPISNCRSVTFTSSHVCMCNHTIVSNSFLLTIPST